MMTVAVDDPEATLPVCELAILRALELGNNRFITRAERSTLRGIPMHELHRHLNIPESRVDALLNGAWELLRITLANNEHREAIIVACDHYARTLIAGREPLDREALRKYLMVAYETRPVRR